MRRPFDSRAAMTIIEKESDAFDDDFRVFFPELKSHLGLLDGQPPSSAMS